MRRKTLILDKKSIAGLVDFKQSITAIENAFREYSKGRVQMPSKIYLHLDKYNGDFRAMPAYIERLDRAALKWVNVHPGNKKHFLPSVMAVIILSDPANGFPLCIMDGTYATNIRTGAAGAVAAKYLARKNSHIIGLVGCGEQAKTQLYMLNELFDIREVRVWGHEKNYIKKFLRDLKWMNLAMLSAYSIKKCVQNCDIIATTTPSRNPLVRLPWLKEGVHINAIGADAKGKQELDPAILQKAKVVVDSWDQASHSGEINVPLKRGFLRRSDIYADIGKIVSGKKKGRIHDKEITVFDSTGMAIQDVAIANLIYTKALKKKRGKWIPLMF